jgi:hypothetical protein
MYTPPDGTMSVVFGFTYGFCSIPEPCMSFRSEHALELSRERGCVPGRDKRERVAYEASRGGAYDPHLGSGLVKIGTNNLPAALIWAFCDDFKIHAPTKVKLIGALNAFMALSL